MKLASSNVDFNSSAGVRDGTFLIIGINSRSNNNVWHFGEATDRHALITADVLRWVATLDLTP